jgi:hypothetical protein
MELEGSSLCSQKPTTGPYPEPSESNEVNMDSTKYMNMIKEKGKGKVVPVLPLTAHHAMKVYWGSGSTAFSTWYGRWHMNMIQNQNQRYPVNHYCLDLIPYLERQIS